MENSKLYIILQHFDKYEQNRCRKYIQSPYFNRSEQLVVLFDTFIKHINKKSKDLLRKAKIWDVLNPQKSFDDVRFRKYCSDLLKLIESYLAQNIYEQNPIHEANNLIKAVGERKLEKLYNSTVKKARIRSKQQHQKSSDYYYNQYKIERNYFDLVDFDLYRDERANYEEIMHNLDQFYFAEQLSIYCATLIREQETSQNYQLSFIHHITTFIEEQGASTFAPIVQLYYQVVLVYTQKEKPNHYLKLKELLHNYAPQILPRQAFSIYSTAVNFCTLRINEGNRAFPAELFDIYNDMIENKTLFADDELSPWHFKNIIVTALLLGKYAWGETFITEYAHMLPEEFRENAVTFNLARLAFEQKHYDKVVTLLREVEYDDISYNIQSKAMLLMIYYDTDEIEPLYSLLESFRTYLNRHKEIPAQRQAYYKNLIKYTKKLTKIMPNDSEALQKFKQEVDNTTGFKVKWLNQKIAALEA